MGEDDLPLVELAEIDVQVVVDISKGRPVCIRTGLKTLIGNNAG